jgi:hypothetical protein
VGKKNNNVKKAIVHKREQQRGKENMAKESKTQKEGERRKWGPR